MKSYFKDIPLAPADPIFGLSHAYNEDKRLDKINFLIGYFKDEEGKTPLFQAVKKAETFILAEEKHKEYLSIDGDHVFTEHICHLLLGDELWPQVKPNLYQAQTIGGTGALRILGEFLKKFISPTIAISDPSWPNHRGVFSHVGMNCVFYPYFDYKQFKINWEAILSYLHSLPEKTVVLFHGNCHNPTGLDFNHEQWQVLSEVCKSKQLFPLFDIAYQGFGVDLDQDAWPVRYFITQHHEMAIAYSCAKNFSLYGERVGALMIYSENGSFLEHVQSQIKVLIRSNYSNPSIHGARIVDEILKSKDLTHLWKEELKGCRQRIDAMRELLVSRLKKRANLYPVDYMGKTLGLFTYTGLNSNEVKKLREEFRVYLIGDGRLNVTGLNHKNIDRVIDALVQIKS